MTSRTGDERALRAALTARAATLVLGVVVFWPIVAGLAAGLEYALIDVQRGVVPSFAMRAALTVSEALIGALVLLVVVRLASSEAPADSRRRSAPHWLALVVLVAAAIAGAAASLWFPYQGAQAVASLGYVRLADWGLETASLATLGLGLRTAAAVAGLLYGAARWRSAGRRLALAAA